MDKLMFSNKVIELRKKQGLTQQQLADRLHVTNKAISRWETGEGFPDIMLLKPLSEALGISCDELLSEHVNYTDIQKSDIQKYIPYGVAALSLLVYYILGKLSVPFILSFFILLAGLWASCYLMIHHTNKEKLPHLIRFDAVMLYFPVVSLFQTITMIWYLLKQSGFSLQGLLFNFNMINYGSDILGDSMGMIDNTVLIYIFGYIGALVSILVLYYLMKNYSIQHYEIAWYGIRINKKDGSGCFNQLQDSTERNVKRVCYVLCAVVFLMIIATIIYQYFSLLNLQFIPNELEVGYGNREVAIKTLADCKQYLYLLVGISGIVPLFGLVKCKRKLIYKFALIWLWVYCAGIIFFTTLEKDIYVKAPMLWMVVGIVIAGMICVCRFTKKNKKI